MIINKGAPKDFRVTFGFIQLLEKDTFFHRKRNLSFRIEKTAKIGNFFVLMNDFTLHFSKVWSFQTNIHHAGYHCLSF